VLNWEWPVVRRGEGLLRYKVVWAYFFWGLGVIALSRAGTVAHGLIGECGGLCLSSKDTVTTFGSIQI